jgi:hypothetical protein
MRIFGQSGKRSINNGTKSSIGFQQFKSLATNGHLLAYIWVVVY